MADEFVTTIHLESGIYNSYFKAKIDKADFKHVFTEKERLLKSKYELQEMIFDKLGQNKHHT